MLLEVNADDAYIAQLLPVPVVDSAMGVPQDRLDILLVCGFKICEDQSVAYGPVPRDISNILTGA